MPITWTLKGEAGKALDATSRTLEQLQASGAVVTFRSLAADTLTWTVGLGAVAEGAVLVPELGQRVTLYRDGSRYFTGWVTGRDPAVTATRATVQITVSGPWWWLQNMALSSDQADQAAAVAERTAFVFTTGSVTSHLQGLTTRAIDMDAPIRAGSIATCFNIPRLSLRNITYAEAFSQLMRWVPDGVLYFDYTGSEEVWPALCMQRRGAAATVTLDPTSAVYRVPVIRLKPRLELKLSEVHVAFAERATVDNKRVTQWAMQSAGTPDLTSPGRQIVTVSGPEMDTYLPQDFTDAVVVRSAPITAADILLAKEDRLRAAGGMFSTIYPPDGIFSATTLNPTITDADGNSLPGDYGYWLAAGEPKSWWPKQNPPIDYIQARLAATIFGSDEHENPIPFGWEPTPPAWYQVIGGQVVSYVVPGTTPKTRWIYWATVTASFTAVKTHWPTDTTLIRDEDYGFINPPPDLAENLLAAQNWVPHEGQVGTAVAPDAIPAGHQLGAKMDLMNVLVEHESMGALITEQTVRPATGEVTYNVGAPARLAYRDLVNQFRQHGADNIVYLNETNPVSPPSGPGAPSSHRTLTEGGEVELGEDGATAVDEDDT